MEILLSSRASKYLERMNEPDKGRIKAALMKLGEAPPLQGDIRLMSGSDEYRARVGGYRILFKIAGNTVFVLDIAPRGQVYKGR